ncbi:MAG: hypothetical protein AABX73_00335 [Nanoarchaeota archaeon]
MKKITKSFLGLIILIIALVVILKILGVDLSLTGEGEYDQFAKCLAEKNIKMYGAFWCPHCLEQKKSFGKSWRYIDYIECSLPNKAQTPKCTQSGIESYPTWEFADGTRREGIISLNELSSKSGCALPE